MKRFRPPAFFFIFVLLLSFSSGARALEEKEIALSEIPLSLEESIKIATQNNRDIQTAVHDFKISGKKIAETKAQFGFNVKLDGNWQRVHDSTSFTTLTYDPMDISGMFAPGTLVLPAGTPLYVANPMPTMNSMPLNKKNSRTMDVTLSKPLLTFGKKPNSLAAMRRGMNISELDVERIELDITMNTVESFFNFLLAKQAYQVMKDNLTLMQDHLAAAQLRYEQGTIPFFDVIRSEVDVEDAKEKLTTAETGLTLARMAFNNTIGLPVERKTDVRFTPTDENINLPQVDEFIDRALKTRVEVRQLQLAQEQVEFGAKTNRNTPMVSLAIMRNLLSSGSAFSSSDTWRYVVAYETNIFDDGLARSRMAQADREKEKLVLSEVDLREGIILQTQQAYQNLLETQKRVKTSQAILRQAEKAREMATIGHEQGVTSQIDWKDAMFGYTQAQLNLANALVGLQVAKAKLANAVGLASLDDFIE